MNLSRNYRFSIFWAITCFGLMAFCFALWEGGSSPVWWDDSPQISTPEREAAVPRSIVAPSVESYAAIWQQPLFSPTRKPEPAAPPPEPTAPSLDDFVVTGIVVTSSARIAMLKQGDGKRLKVKEGEGISNGWTVDKIENHEVAFSHGTHRQSLRLAGRKPAF